VFLTGDTNIRLGRQADPYTVRFHDLLDSFALTQHVSEPTHNLCGILDVVITRSDDSPSSVMVNDVGVFDHTWCRGHLTCAERPHRLMSLLSGDCGKPGRRRVPFQVA